MSKPRIIIKGQDKLVRKLKALGSQRVCNRILKATTNAATTPLLRAVKAETPEDKGDLKKSMAKKVAGKGFKANGIVGSDTTKIDADGQRAARHLHLVEKGFEHVGGEVVPGAHMLAKGFDDAKDKCAQVYAQKLAEGIEKEAAKA